MGLNHREREISKKKGTARVPPQTPLRPAIHYNRRTDKIHCVRNDQSKEPKTQLNNKEKGREPLRQLRRNHIFA